MSMPRRPLGSSCFAADSSSGVGQHDAVDAGRMLAGSLDTLVRACRANAPSVPNIAARTLTVWKSEPAIEMALEADKLIVLGKEVMTAGEPDGRWILLAFMAGMRSLRPEPEAAPEDLVRLAQKLAALKPELAGIQELRDWLWSDGAEGFLVNMDFGFSEGLEAAVLDLHAHREALALARTQAAMSLSAEAVSVASRELDVASVRDEFQLPLQYFTRATTSRRLVPSDSERDEARTQWEDPAFWLDAQLLLTMEYAHLKCSQPILKLATRALNLMEHAPMLRAMQFWERLSKREEPLAMDLRHEMERRQVGVILARRLAQAEGSLDMLASHFAESPTVMSQDMATELLERCIQTDSSFRCLGKLVQTVGLARFQSHLRIPNLSHPAVVALCRVVQLLGAPMKLHQEILERCDPVAGIRASQTMGLEFRRRFGWLMQRFVLEAPVREAVAFAELLSQDAGYDWATDFAKALTGSHREIAPALVRCLCTLVGRSASGGDLLLPLLRSPGIALETRLAAARCMRNHPDATAQALRWRVSDMVAAADVRLALQELKEQSRGGKA